jgi:uncharacterized protein (DUF427 family)
MASGHQITITPIDQHVEVTLGGERLASSDKALLLQETGSPDRYYLPADDVRTELLKPTSTTTTCPFKGEAAYWSAEAGGEVYQDVVWSYPDPIPAAAQIAGLLCFWAERGAEVAVTSPQPAR